VTKFVLDASFAMTWVMEAERTPLSMKLYDALSREQTEAVVPALWCEEMANVFLTVERSRRLTATQVATWLEILRHLPIVIDPPSLHESFGEVRSLAQAHGLTAYDARYLHLAMREALPLATRDKQLLAVAPKVGVKLIHT
jgi:predicted nucleic acid-binding protein